MTVAVDGLTDRRVTKARDRKQVAALSPAAGDNGAFPDGLTARQHAFANGIVAGLSQIEAYLRAYNWSGSRESAIAHASSLASEGKVARAISRRIAEKEERASHSAAAIKRHVVDGFMELTKSSNESIRLRAFDRLGHIAGVDLFRDKPAAKPLDELGSTELEARIRERLREALAIDVTPIPDGE